MSMYDNNAVLRLWTKGVPSKEIAARLGMHPAYARAIVRRARLAGIGSGESLRLSHCSKPRYGTALSRFQSDEHPSAALSVTAARGRFLPGSLAAFRSTITPTVSILKTSATHNSEANEELVAWVTANHTIWSHAL